MSTGKVVSSIFLSSDELFWMEQLAVSASTDFLNNCWLKVDKYCTWYGLPAPVSEKKVLKASSPPPIVLSDGIYSSG